MPKLDDYHSKSEIQWCPGCPNHGILEALKKALVQMHKAPYEVCLVSGIGQAAKLPHYLHCNAFNGLHGRAVPTALGLHAAQPGLTTIVVTGDGDCYGEGGNHFLHALRRNPDITVLVHNNEIYGLTKGQASPTTPRGEKRALQSGGVPVAPLNMPAIALVQGCTFVARGFAGDVAHLKKILVQAIKHRGLSYVDIIQPCITFGHPVSWYKKKIVPLGDDHDAGDRTAALEKVMTQGDKIPVGILYRTGPEEVFGHRFRKAVGDGPLTDIKPLGKEAVIRILSEFLPAKARDQ
jgi:2-oxoglutarate ferredoxin oxidoreductase subunit beta